MEAAAVTNALRPGAALGARLGKGAFGCVYVCEEDPGVAVKVSHRDRMCFDTWRECTALHQLRPVDRATYLGARMDSWGCSRLAMRRAACTLRDVVDCALWKDLPHGLRAALALPWLFDVRDQLEHAHRRGIVHRDVKLANCLLFARGEGVAAGASGAAGAAGAAGAGEAVTAGGAGAEAGGGAGACRDGAQGAHDILTSLLALLADAGVRAKGSVWDERDGGEGDGEGDPLAGTASRLSASFRAQVVDWGSCIAHAEAFDATEEEVTTWTYRPMELLCHGIDRNARTPCTGAHDMWSFGLLASHLAGWSTETDCDRAHKQTARVASLTGVGPREVLDALRCGVTRAHWPLFVQHAACGVPDIDHAGGRRGATECLRTCVRACLRYAPEDRRFGLPEKAPWTRAAPPPVLPAVPPAAPPAGPPAVPASAELKGMEPIYPCAHSGQRRTHVGRIVADGSRAGFQPHVLCHATALFDAAWELGAVHGDAFLAPFTENGAQRALAAAALIVSACSLEKFQESPQVVARRMRTPFAEARKACVALFNAMCGGGDVGGDGGDGVHGGKATKLRSAFTRPTPLVIARRRCLARNLGARVSDTVTYLLCAAAPEDFYCQTDPSELAEEALICATLAPSSAETRLWAWLAKTFPDGCSP